MKIKQTHRLSEQEADDIRALIHRCRQAEELTISFPFEEFTSVYLLYESEHQAPTLSAVFGLILPETKQEPPQADQEEDLQNHSAPYAEGFALTHPARRQRGCFLSLLAAAEPEFEDYDLLFLTDHQSDGALKTLEALEAELISDEYRMEYLLKDSLRIDPSFHSPLFLREQAEENQTHRYEFFLSPDPSQACIARCRTRDFGTEICFYDFQVEETVRGMGFGKKALLQMLHLLRDRQYTRIYLHVSGDNLPAVSLYQKTGFRICETLSLFLY